MAYAHYDRLSGVDATFLDVESPNAHMHIGSVCIFDAGPLTRSEGGIDFDRIVEFADAQLKKNPRFRQKITYIPGFAHPAWVDDASFNLTYHMRHTALPAPGDERQLKRLAGRIMSQQLDRGKPLWEVWFVEGIEGGRFALITKMHHCMADGISGIDLLKMLMGTDPDYLPKPAPKWIPRPAPTPGRLVVDEIARRLAPPLPRLGEDGERRARRERARETLRGVVETASNALHSITRTPLNVEIGPHRRLDWTQTDLDDVREIRSRAGGTVNDVVLAVASGAVRRFLKQRGVRVDDLEFRAMVPVSLRSDAERNTGRVIDTTRELKGSRQTLGGDVLGQIADRLASRLTGRLARWAARRNVANMVITNVPGPEMQVYLLGARMLEDYPVVPLAPTQALGVALFSYQNRLYWGFNSDWDAVPDLHDFVEAVHVEFEALRKAVAPSASVHRISEEPAATSARPA
jgi:hypothetical protein